MSQDKVSAAVEMLGATGEFPGGKLNEHDEGELQFRIGADTERKKVVIDFGKSISWIGFNPEDARELAIALLEAADKAQKNKKENA